MPDWTKSMKQTYEYYKVDPLTWFDTEQLTTVVSSEVDRDYDTDTKYTASLKITGEIDECYVRSYLVTTQNGRTEKFPLATVLVQTPSKTFNGKYMATTLDTYSPLVELKENYPPLGYSVLKTQQIMPVVSRLCDENMRAPVVDSTSTETLQTDFVSDPDDDWLQFLSDLMANANFRFDVDAMGNILFAPVQDVASLQSVWTYTDDNSSILYSDVDIERDLYGIPNALEIVFQQDSYHLYVLVVNEDPNSPVSTVSRGRRITKRITSPDIFGIPNQQQLNDYAIQLLKNMSTVEYTISYSHGYCPVRIGDCVLLNYKRAGLKDIKALVKTQHITCDTGCKVQETAVYTMEVGNKFKVYTEEVL